MSGTQEIYDFGEKWRSSKNFRVTPIGNFVFAASVVYESPSRGTEVENCTVQMFRSGMEDGNIEIYEYGKLENETHHLGFTTKWQEYRFDSKNGSFVVAGKSPKMGGAYKVTICPNGAIDRFA